MGGTLIDAAGIDKFKALLHDQTYAHARELYGAVLDTIVGKFEQELYSMR